MMSCDIDKWTVEQMTSWTYSESGPAVAGYRACMEHKGLRNSAVYTCQLPLKKHCGKFVQNSLDVGCHKFMMVAHGENTSIEIPSGFPSPEQYRTCARDIRHRLASCIPLLKQACKSTKYKAIKLLRADFDFIEDLVKKWPDVKIVYQVRDPRGTLVSRLRGSRQFLPSLAAESSYLCPKMERDIEKYHQLKLKYPDKLHLLTYEDLAANTLHYTEEIYKFLDIPLTEEIKAFMYSITHADKDGKHFEEKRKNANATAYAWRKSLKAPEKKLIDANCLNVYQSMGYKI